MSLLANLAQFASAAASGSSTRTPMEALSIEEARAAVKVVDGSKKPAADGSQALVLRFGKLTLSLDAIAKGATRVNATKEQAADFTAQLEGAVKEGAFDAAITEAQEKIRVQKATPKVAKPPKPSTITDEVEGEAPKTSTTTEAEIDGLDLDSLSEV